MRVGLIGAGNISDQYLTHLSDYPDVDVVAVGDIDLERARAQAEKYGVPESGTAQFVLDHPDVELIVNLTVPTAHADIDLLALEAGKHIWSEKPLATSLEAARGVLDLAATKGLRIGCAPDTVLGPGIQATLRLVREHIGGAVTGLALFQNRGPDLWHPNIEFFYGPGGGPVLDIGPYYLTSLVLGLGPVTSVTAIGGRARTERVVQAGVRQGNVFPVEVPTHAEALLTHASGATSTAIFSFDSPRARHVLEFGGVDATVEASDPNTFGGRVTRHGAPVVRGEEIVDVVDVDPAGAGRGIGVVDMVRSIAEGTAHRASGELAYHVLEIMLAINEAVESQGTVAIVSTVAPVDLLPEGWSPTAALVR